MFVVLMVLVVSMFFPFLVMFVRLSVVAIPLLVHFLVIVIVVIVIILRRNAHHRSTREHYAYRRSSPANSLAIALHRLFILFGRHHRTIFHTGPQRHIGPGRWRRHNYRKQRLRVGDIEVETVGTCIYRKKAYGWVIYNTPDNSLAYRPYSTFSS